MYKVCSSSPFKFGLYALDLRVTLHFRVLCFGIASGLNLSQVDAHVQLGLGSCELSISLSLFAFALCLDDGSLSIEDREGDRCQGGNWYGYGYGRIETSRIPFST